MEKEKLLFALILFVSFFAFGEDLQANEVYAKSEQEKLQLEDFHEFAKHLETVIEALPTRGKGCKDCGAEVQNLEPIESGNQNGIWVFISFSMPKAALIELNNQAKKYNARLILRGIYKNSFSKTKDRILEIEPKGLVVDIDPQLFKQYKIERVPTFVLLKNGKEIGRLSGNVTLEFARSKLIGAHQ